MKEIIKKMIKDIEINIARCEESKLKAEKKGDYLDRIFEVGKIQAFMETQIMLLTALTKTDQS